MNFIESVGLMLPAARPTNPEEVASAPDWRADYEFPHIGEPYRSVAKTVGLRWAESLHQNDLDVSTEVPGLVQLTESGDLHADSIVCTLQPISTQSHSDRVTHHRAARRAHRRRNPHHRMSTVDLREIGTSPTSVKPRR